MPVPVRGNFNEFDRLQIRRPSPRALFADRLKITSAPERTETTALGEDTQGVKAASWLSAKEASPSLANAMTKR